MLDFIDLEQILKIASSDFKILAGKRIFITGGTGYIGRWLLEALFFVNQQVDANIKVCVLTRNPDAFKNKFPHLAFNPNLELIAGDIRSFDYPDGKFDFAIHAATDVIEIKQPLEIFEVTAGGTQYFLRFCECAKIKEVLLLSSGAVYGVIPQDINLVNEDYAGRPSTERLDSAYGIGKIATEWLGSAYTFERGLSCKSARVFAQVGPYLTLNKQFAAGNFLRDALEGNKFLIKGDGTPMRSYMYGADLIVWLVAILVRGQGGKTYNVGSDKSISIKDLANLIASIANISEPNIEIQGIPSPLGLFERYVPDITRAKSELNLKINVDLESSFQRTFSWYENHREWINR